MRAAGGAYAVLRTSWVVSAHGNNFVKTMLRLGRERERLTIVADQIGAPTPARDIAAACLAMARQLMAEDAGKSGTYHFARRARDQLGGFRARDLCPRPISPVAVEDIPTTAYPTPAARPLNSRLDCAVTRALFLASRSRTGGWDCAIF